MVQERLWIDHHHPPHHLPLQTHHPHPRTDLVCATSPKNGFAAGKDPDSPGSSDSEDLHYGPGIVNRLRNKYLSLALRESNNRPTILRKATSLENLLDDDGGDEGGKEEVRLFARRKGANDGENRYRSSNRRNQEMKRARSVEVISRTNQEEELTMTSSVTAKINNRQSLHEDMLIQANEDKGLLIENTRSYKKQISIENGTDGTDKYTKRLNKPKRIPPLLNEREKPPVDVVKHAKMIFEKRPETRTKKPHPTGEVAAKVDSFNDIIVKTKVALKHSKPAIKTAKPVLNDKSKSHAHHQHVRPVAKPVILSEEMLKPKSLDLRPQKQDKKGFNSLPSPIPDVSRVDIKHQDGGDSRNSSNSLCETPDLILTSSPVPKITSPTYRKRTTENFLKEERDRSLSAFSETTNKYVSPNRSPTKSSYNHKPSILNFNKEDQDLLGIRMISPISQKNITTNSATSVFNFINAQVDQRHLPLSKNNSPDRSSPVADINGFGSGKIKMGISAFEMEKNLKNAAKSGLEHVSNGVSSTSEEPVRPEEELVDRKLVGKDETGPKNTTEENKSWQNLGHCVEKTSNIYENLSKKPQYKNNKTGSDPPSSVDVNQVEVIESITVDSSCSSKKAVTLEDKTVMLKVQNKSASDKSSVVEITGSVDKEVLIVLPKKTKPRQEESTSAVFNFTSRKDVPDYIANDTSKTPSRIVIPKPDEPGIKLLSEAHLASFKEIQEVWEEDEIIRSLEARPPSPCDVTFINDNVLIDGKSSLIQSASKRVKLKISFVDDAEIYEYPSETSLLVDEAMGGQLGHAVPTLSGSSLATYQPKTTEDFQLGVTKSFQEPPSLKSDVNTAQPDQPQPDVLLEEVDQPVLFSSGSTSDILF